MRNLANRVANLEARQAERKARFAVVMWGFGEHPPTREEAMAAEGIDPADPAICLITVGPFEQSIARAQPAARAALELEDAPMRTPSFEEVQGRSPGAWRKDHA